MQRDASKQHGEMAIGFDYRALESKLKAAHAALESAWAPTSQESREVLLSRAQALARPNAPAQAPAALIEVLEFNLAYERYAIESRYVREVFPLENLTPVPCTPAHVLGVANLRGEIMSVLDIRAFFELPKVGLPDLNKVLVLESEHMNFGLLVDAVIKMDQIPVTAIQPALPAMTGIRQTYLRGLTEDCMAILDGALLLSDTAIVVNESVHEN